MKTLLKVIKMIFPNKNKTWKHTHHTYTHTVVNKVMTATFYLWVISFTGSVLGKRAHF